jgi:hypothetical protein
MTMMMMVMIMMMVMMAFYVFRYANPYKDIQTDV